MQSSQTASEKYGIYAAITVLLGGPIFKVFKEGWQVVGESDFWFGLYGWLSAAIIVGYVVHLVLQIFGRTSNARKTSTNDEEASALNSQSKIDGGKLPAWEIAELPKPPRFNLLNSITLSGPGVILLGTSIGSGEWLLGPAVTSQYGGSMLWLAIVSIVFQVVMNTEFVRYTMYTGEPIYTGFMRTNPGSGFWAIFYSVVAFLQLSWPGCASAAATAITALYIGDMPSFEDSNIIRVFGLIWFLSTIVITLFGDKIEKTIELLQWFFIISIILFLTFVAVRFSSFETIEKANIGFTRFGVIPPGVDWAIIGAFVADAGAGGVVNGTLGNWYRDRGFAMGGVVGYIPAIVGGSKVALTQVGKIFPLNFDNKKNWRAWWKFVHFDQYGLWAIGSFLGILLPALLTLQFIPPGTRFNNQFGIAVYQAEYILWSDKSNILWFLTLLVGFWILYSTQLGITDAFVRMVTDILWSGSRYVREWRGGDIRFVYYGVLSLFTLWGIYVLLIMQVRPLFLIKLGANMAGLNFVFLGLHTLYVNRKFLPAEIRAPLWKEIIVFLGVTFFAFFSIKALPIVLSELFVSQ
jgi:hypothetical protein